MCGICGYVNYQKDITKYKSNIKKMTKTLIKRGPDQKGYFIDKNCLLGHRRLSVMDPFNGLQPYTYDGLTIVYNGELYNTDELKDDLSTKGYLFDTTCDTEVVLKMYHYYKENSLDMLNGIYAFAVFNKDELFIVRDRLGVKPLYYKLHDNGIIFASEIKAILKHKDVQPIIDLDGLSELLSFSPSSTPGTSIYKDIQSLRPGHYIKYNKEEFNIKRYFYLESKKHEDDFETTKLKVRQLLEDAIKKQLISDVPIATFLSGGLDSSIISIIASMNKENLTTYSIDYVDNDKYFKSDGFTVSSDDYFINIVKNKYKLNHKKKVINTKQLIKYLKDAVVVRDMPGMADIDSSLLWFSKEIKKNHTVCLSGECADEIFFGYPWYYKKELLDIEYFPWMRNTSDRQKLINKNLNINIADKIKKGYKDIISEVEYCESDTELDKKYRALNYINLTHFMTTLLDRKDRMTMGGSLEVRVPFSDHRIIEYLWNVPFDFKHYKGVEKGLLREAFKDVLPDEIYNRKKSPYPKTFNPEYTKILSKKLKKCLKDKNSILHKVFDIVSIYELLNNDNSNFDIPWFGQLMKKPQLIAYLYQFHYFGKKYKIILDI